MGAGHRYELVKGGDDNNTEEPKPTITQPRQISISWWKFLLCNLLAASLGAAATFLIARASISAQPSSGSVTIATTPTASSAALAVPTPSIENEEVDAGGSNMLTGTILDCGGNPQEAREKGCVYDVMMQDWVPVPCYDRVLTEKYLAEGNWTWYGAGDGSITIPLEEMRKGEHGSAWMATSYHKAHCVFSWLKIIRALRNNRGISQELLSYDHVLHCAHGALKENSEDQGLGVRAPTNYAKCAVYDTWIQDLIPDKHNSTMR